MSEQLWRVERISGDGEKWLATDESPLRVADDPLLRLVPVEPCEHGYVDGHPVDNPPYFDWCFGSPTLAVPDGD